MDAYVILMKYHEYNDEYYQVISHDAGSATRVYLNKEMADKECDRLNRETVRNIKFSNYGDELGDIFGYGRNIGECIGFIIKHKKYFNLEDVEDDEIKDNYYNMQVTYDIPDDIFNKFYDMTVLEFYFVNCAELDEGILEDEGEENGQTMEALS